MKLRLYLCDWRYLGDLGSLSEMNLLDNITAHTQNIVTFNNKVNIAHFLFFFNGVLRKAQVAAFSLV